MLGSPLLLSYLVFVSVICENILTWVKEEPSMYYEPRLHYLQKFVSLVEQNPGMFHSVEGDDNFDMPLRGEEQITEVTKGYVKALAELRSGETIAENPILSVYSSPKTQYYVDVTG